MTGRGPQNTLTNICTQPEHDVASHQGREWSNGLAPVLLVTAVLLWSGNFIVGRAIGGEVSALGLNFWRWSLAFLVLLPLALPELRRSKPQIALAWNHLCLLGLTGIAAFHVFVYKAIEHTTATNALLVLSTAPAAIMLLSRWTIGEPIHRRQWYGIVLSFAGAVVLICQADLHALSSPELGSGELWMLAAVPTWAVYSALLKRLPAALPQRATLTVSTASGLLCMAPFVLVMPESLAIDWTPSVAASVLYIGIGASVVAFISWNQGVSRVGPALAGVYLHLMPLFGATMGFALLGESLHAYHALGVALVVAGITLTQYSGSLVPMRSAATQRERN